MAGDSSQVNNGIDITRRKFLIDLFKISCAFPVLGALVPCISSCLPGAKAKQANKPIRVDVSHMQPGQQMTVHWQGKPVWIIYRTSEMLAELDKTNFDLRDPSSSASQQPTDTVNQYRSIRPQYAVLVGVCTHLGCIPVYKPKISPGGELYCPCHGSRFDLAGRVYKNVPAPINLEVPPYRWIDNFVIEIGEAVHE